MTNARIDGRDRPESASAITGEASSPLSSSSTPSQASPSGAAGACSEGGAGSLLHPSDQVTPQMIGAGIDTYLNFSEDDGLDVVLSAVFRSMLQARG